MPANFCTGVGHPLHDKRDKNLRTEPRLTDKSNKLSNQNAVFRAAKHGTNIAEWQWFT
jgi:hypothetical protein